MRFLSAQKRFRVLEIAFRHRNQLNGALGARLEPGKDEAASGEDKSGQRVLGVRMRIARSVARQEGGQGLGRVRRVQIGDKKEENPDDDSAGNQRFRKVHKQFFSRWNVRLKFSANTANSIAGKAHRSPLLRFTESCPVTGSLQ